MTSSKLMVAAAAVSVMIAAMLAWQLSGQRAMADASRSRLEQLVTRAAKLDQLRADAASRTRAPIDQVNLMSNLNAALLEAGLPVTALTNLTPEADGPVMSGRGGAGDDAASRYRRQAARVTIEQVTLPQVGKFLAAWRTAQPRWMVTSLQVQPAPAAAAPDRAVGEIAHQPLRMYLVIESTYLDLPSASTPESLSSGDRT